MPLICLFNYAHDILRDPRTPADNATRDNILHNVRVSGCERVVFWTDRECSAALRQYDVAVGAAFDAEPDGRLRSDICRLEMLRRTGGVYMDNDLRLLINPTRLMRSQTRLLTVRASSSCHNPAGLFQALLASVTDHPMLAIALRAHVAWHRARLAGNGSEIARVTWNRARPNVGTVLLLDAMVEHLGPKWTKAWYAGSHADVQLFHEHLLPRVRSCYCRVGHGCNFVATDPATRTLVLLSRFRAGAARCLSPYRCKPCAKRRARLN